MWKRDLYRGFELFGKNVGIIGLGRIGRIVSEYYRAFGMNIYYYDPYVENQNNELINKGSLEELLELVDVISIHVTGCCNTIKYPFDAFNLFPTPPYF